MASDNATLLEHVVLLKVKEETSPEQIATVVSALRGLKQIKEALEVTAGPLLQPLPSSGFTHALYARFKDKEALHAYEAHPQHESLVRGASEVVDNLLSVDWEASPHGPAISQAPAAVRIVLVKPKEGVKLEDLGPLAEAVRSYTALLWLPHDGSLGTNFSGDRGQGHNWGFVLRFQSVKALEKLRSDPRQLHVLEEKLAPLAASFIVVDLPKEA